MAMAIDFTENGDLRVPFVWFLRAAAIRVFPTIL